MKRKEAVGPFTSSSISTFGTIFTLYLVTLQFSVIFVVGYPYKFLLTGPQVQTPSYR
jgi:hypothetical protein